MGGAGGGSNGRVDQFKVANLKHWHNLKDTGANLKDSTNCDRILKNGD